MAHLFPRQELGLVRVEWRGLPCAAGSDAEQSIARIAQSGKDVSFGIQAIIDRCRVDGERRIMTSDGSDPFWCGQEVDETHALRASRVDLIERGDGAAASGQHGIDQQRFEVLQPGGNADVVVFRLQRLFIATKADESDNRARNQIQQRIKHAQTGPQNRHQENSVFQSNTMRARHRGSHPYRTGLKIPSRFIDKQGGQLPQQSSEFLRRGFLITQARQALKHQRMS